MVGDGTTGVIGNIAGVIYSAGVGDGTRVGDSAVIIDNATTVIVEEYEGAVVVDGARITDDSTYVVGDGAGVANGSVYVVGDCAII